MKIIYIKKRTIKLYENAMTIKNKVVVVLLTHKMTAILNKQIIVICLTK